MIDLANADLIVDNVYSGSRNGNASDDPLPKLLGVDNGAGFRHQGVGRFAAHQIGKNLELVTRRKEGTEVVVNIDWDLFDKGQEYLDAVSVDVVERLPEVFVDQRSGTRLVMRVARQPWNENLLKKVHRTLRRLQSPLREDEQRFKVKLECPEYPEYETIDPTDLLDKAHYEFRAIVDKDGQCDFDYLCKHPATEAQSCGCKPRGMYSSDPTPDPTGCLYPETLRRASVAEWKLQITEDANAKLREQLSSQAKEIERLKTEVATEYLRGREHERQARLVQEPGWIEWAKKHIDDLERVNEELRRFADQNTRLVRSSGLPARKPRANDV